MQPMPEDQGDSDPVAPPPPRGVVRPDPRLALFGRSVPLPASTVLRISLGLLLCMGGLLWFLPMVGIWMLPLGFAVLSVDIPIVRRWSGRTAVRLRRRYPGLMRHVHPKPAPESARRRRPDSSRPD